MTETEWLENTSAEEMLSFLMMKYESGGGSDRKLRLVACAYCRRIWSLLGDERSRRAVEVAERFADGLAGRAELTAAAAGAAAVVQEVSKPVGRWPAALEAATWGVAPSAARAALAAAADWLAQSSADPDTLPPGVIGPATDPVNAARYTREAGREAGRAAARAAGDAAFALKDVHWEKAKNAAYKAEVQEQVAILRDVLGNPFRSALVDPSWLHWDWRSVVMLARTIYEERSYQDLPVLGDAAEEAGCGNANLLLHCRARQGHVRGCWVVDWLLGKK
jgi:hypothetical protein